MNKRSKNILKLKKTIMQIKKFSSIHHLAQGQTFSVGSSHKHQKVSIGCPLHGWFEQTTKQHLKKHGCIKCGRKKRNEPQKLTHDEFKRRFDENCKGKYRLISNYDPSISKKVTVECPIHGPFEVYSGYSLRKKIGCSKCSKKYQRTNEEYLKEISKVQGTFYDLSKVNYINRKTKILIGCPVHGEFKVSPVKFLEGSGCPRCQESSGERKIRVFLEKYQIPFEYQKKFADCRNIQELVFDFFVKEQLLIEFDGEQHFRPCKLFGGQKGFDKRKENDTIKDDYCKSKGIKLLRISYLEISKIEEILLENIQ